VFGYSGGFVPWLGVPFLFSAVARVVMEGLDVRVLLIGAGPQEKEIKEITKGCGLEDRVTFTGYVGIKELADYLRDVEIGVSPYCGREEYSGLKLLDYKAAGFASIASGVGGEPEVIEHGRTGWIVPPCDELALSETITLLVNNVDLRRRLGQTARFEAEMEHSWRHTALQLNEVFLRFAEKPSTKQRG
jgi:glycosyltransferase involved in cell wall biosynthesis